LNYIIITPAKDEEKFISNTLDSVIRQTLLPMQWIIVNDGSIDNTTEIVEQYSENFPWIKLIDNKTKNSKREEGSKIVKAFLYGLDSIDYNEYEFIAKLDADLTIPQDYFEKISDEFVIDNIVGMCGGYITTISDNNVIESTKPGYHLRGAIKTYRKTCYDDIGGLIPVLGWDGIDEMTAMYKGWKVKILNLEVIQHRPTAKNYNQIKLNFNRGLLHYKKGSSFLLIIIRMVVRLNKKPLIVGACFILIGYIYGLIVRSDKILDKELQKYINRFHFKRLITFKR